MTRLASQANAMYEPTSLRAIAGIARMFKFEWPVRGPIRIIDPAAGTGRALAFLVRDLCREMPEAPVETYGIEVAADRAREARNYLKNVLHADAINGAKVTIRSFDMVFCNPPYNREKGASELKRLEEVFLIRATQLLRSGGALAFVIGESTLAELADTFAAFYNNIAVRRFARPEYDQWQQVVVVGIRKNQRAANPKIAEGLRAMGRGEAEIKLLDVPKVEEMSALFADLWHSGIRGEEIEEEVGLIAGSKLPLEEINKPGVPAGKVITVRPEGGNARKITFDYAEFHEAEALNEAMSGGIWQQNGKRELVYLPPARAMAITPPLMPMRIGMTSQFLQIGLGNNLLLTNGSKKIVIKGRTVKKWREIGVEYDDEGRVKKSQFKEVISSDIKVLNLADGQIETIDSLGMGELVSEFKDSIQAQMLANYPPLYVPKTLEKRQEQVKELEKAVTRSTWQAGKQGKPDPKIVAEYKKAQRLLSFEEGLAYLKRRPLGGQRVAIAAAALALHSYGYGTLECEMGSGKTFLAIATAWLSGARRIIVSCPPTLVKIWEDEIKATIPGADSLIVRTPQDLEKARAKILEHERLIKLSYSPRSSVPEFVQKPPFFVIMATTDMKMESGWDYAVVYHPPRGENEPVEKKYKIGKEKFTKTIYHKEGAHTYPRSAETGELKLDPDTRKFLMWPHCPRCDAPVLDKRGIPKRLIKSDNSKKEQCSVCGEPLWQVKSKLLGASTRFNWEKEAILPVPAEAKAKIKASSAWGLLKPKWAARPLYRDTNPAGTRKVKLSKYIQLRMNHFFDLWLGDEIHQSAPRSSKAA